MESQASLAIQWHLTKWAVSTMVSSWILIARGCFCERGGKSDGRGRARARARACEKEWGHERKREWEHESEMIGWLCAINFLKLNIKVFLCQVSVKGITNGLYLSLLKCTKTLSSVYFHSTIELDLSLPSVNGATQVKYTKTVRHYSSICHFLFKLHIIAFSFNSIPTLTYLIN